MNLWATSVQNDSAVYELIMQTLNKIATLRKVILTLLTRSPSYLQLQEASRHKKTTGCTEGLSDALMGLKLKLFNWILRNL